MELRNYGENTTLETRSEAQEGVDKRLRQQQIIECLLEARKGHLLGSNAPSPVGSREAPPTSTFPGFSEPPWEAP